VEAGVVVAGTVFLAPTSVGIVGPNRSVPALSRRLNGRRLAPGILDGVGCSLASAFTRLRGSGEPLWDDEVDDCEPLLEE
jgi:hypothetical protein